MELLVFAHRPCDSPQVAQQASITPVTLESVVRSAVGVSSSPPTLDPASAMRARVDEAIARNRAQSAVSARSTPSSSPPPPVVQPTASPLPPGASPVATLAGGPVSAVDEAVQRMRAQRRPIAVPPPAAAAVSLPLLPPPVSVGPPHLLPPPPPSSSSALPQSSQLLPPPPSRSITPPPQLMSPPPSSFSALPPPPQLLPPPPSSSSAPLQQLLPPTTAAQSTAADLLPPPPPSSAELPPPPSLLPRGAGLPPSGGPKRPSLPPPSNLASLPEAPVSVVQAPPTAASGETVQPSRPRLPSLAELAALTDASGSMRASHSSDRALLAVAAPADASSLRRASSASDRAAVAAAVHSDTSGSRRASSASDRVSGRAPDAAAERAATPAPPPVAATAALAVPPVNSPAVALPLSLPVVESGSLYERFSGAGGGSSEATDLPAAPPAMVAAVPAEEAVLGAPLSALPRSSSPLLVSVDSQPGLQSSWPRRASETGGAAESAGSVTAELREPLRVAVPEASDLDSPAAPAAAPASTPHADADADAASAAPARPPSAVSSSVEHAIAKGRQVPARKGSPLGRRPRTESGGPVPFGAAAGVLGVVMAGRSQKRPGSHERRSAAAVAAAQQPLQRGVSGETDDDAASFTPLGPPEGGSTLTGTTGSHGRRSSQEDAPPPAPPPTPRGLAARVLRPPRQVRPQTPVYAGEGTMATPTSLRIALPAAAADAPAVQAPPELPAYLTEAFASRVAALALEADRAVAGASVSFARDASLPPRRDVLAGVGGSPPESVSRPFGISVGGASPPEMGRRSPGGSVASSPRSVARTTVAGPSKAPPPPPASGRVTASPRREAGAKTPGGGTGSSSSGLWAGVWADHEVEGGRAQQRRPAPSLAPTGMRATADEEEAALDRQYASWRSGRHGQAMLDMVVPPLHQQQQQQVGGRSSSFSSPGGAAAAPAASGEYDDSLLQPWERDLPPPPPSATTGMSQLVKPVLLDQGGYRQPSDAPWPHMAGPPAHHEPVAPVVGPLGMDSLRRVARAMDPPPSTNPLSPFYPGAAKQAPAAANAATGASLGTGSPHASDAPLTPPPQGGGASSVPPKPHHPEVPFHYLATTYSAGISFGAGTSLMSQSEHAAAFFRDEEARRDERRSAAAADVAAASPGSTRQLPSALLRSPPSPVRALSPPAHPSAAAAPPAKPAPLAPALAPAPALPAPATQAKPGRHHVHAGAAAVDEARADGTAVPPRGPARSAELPSPPGPPRSAGDPPGWLLLQSPPPPPAAAPPETQNSLAYAAPQAASSSPSRYSSSAPAEPVPLPSVASPSLSSQPARPGLQPPQFGPSHSYPLRTVDRDGSPAAREIVGPRAPAPLADTAAGLESAWPAGPGARAATSPTRATSAKGRGSESAIGPATGSGTPTPSRAQNSGAAGVSSLLSTPGGEPETMAAAAGSAGGLTMRDGLSRILEPFSRSHNLVAVGSPAMLTGSSSGGSTPSLRLPVPSSLFLSPPRR